MTCTKRKVSYPRSLSLSRYFLHEYTFYDCQNINLTKKHEKYQIQEDSQPYSNGNPFLNPFIVYVWLGYHMSFTSSSSDTIMQTKQPKIELLCFSCKNSEFWFVTFPTTTIMGELKFALEPTIRRQKLFNNNLSHTKHHVREAKEQPISYNCYQYLNDYYTFLVLRKVHTYKHTRSILSVNKCFFFLARFHFHCFANKCILFLGHN